VDRLQAAGGEVMSDHGRGCEGRNYTCTCGYDDALMARATAAEAENAKLRAIIIECPIIGSHETAARFRKRQDEWLHSSYGQVLQETTDVG